PPTLTTQYTYPPPCTRKSMPMRALSGLPRPVTAPTTSALSAEFVGKHSRRPSAVRPTAFWLLLRALLPLPALLAALRAASAFPPPISMAIAPAMAARRTMDVPLLLVIVACLPCRTGVAPPASAPLCTGRARRLEASRARCHDRTPDRGCT